MNELLQVRVRVAAVVVLLAAVVPAQGIDVEKVLAEAQKLHEAKQSERASQLLQEALQKLGAMPDKGGQAAKGEAGKVEELLSQVDPHSRLLREKLAKAAGHLVDLARSFRNRKWYAVSLRLLREAEAIDAGTATRALAGLQRAAPQAFRSEATFLPSMREAVAAEEDYEKFQAREMYGQGWTITPDLITSAPAKPGDKGSSSVLLTGPETRDCVFRIEVKRVDKTGAAGILLGTKDDGDFFLLETRLSPGEPLDIRLLHYANGKFTEVGGKAFPLSEKARNRWLPYRFRIQGKSVKITLAGREVLEATCERPPHGKIGMFVSPSHGPVSRVLYRHLKIEALGARPTERESPVLRAERAEQQVLLKAIANAEASHVRDRQRALIMLFEVQSRAAKISDQKLRDSVLEAESKLLARIYSGHAKVRAARAAAAKALEEAATAYTDGLWHRTADRLLRVAAALDYASVAAALKKNTAQLARLAASGVGAGAGGADNKVLSEWFKGGQRLKGEGKWSHGQALVPGTDSLGEQVLISTRKLDKPANVSLQVKADGTPVQFGVILGYQSPDDYYQLSIEHGTVDTGIQLYHVAKGQLEAISTTRSVVFDKEARSSWITVHLDIWDNSLLVKLGNTRKQVIWIGKSTLGNLGLFLKVREDRHGVQFRNLVVEPKESKNKKQ